MNSSLQLYLHPFPHGLELFGGEEGNRDLLSKPKNNSSRARFGGGATPSGRDAIDGLIDVLIF